MQETPEGSEWNPLKSGMILQNRYMIHEKVARHTDRMIYSAGDATGQKWCPACEILSDPSENEPFCEECGAELAPGQYRVTVWPSDREPAGLDAFIQSAPHDDGWLAPMDWLVWEGKRLLVQLDPG